MAQLETHKEAVREPAPAKTEAPQPEEKGEALERWHRPIDLVRRMLAWNPFEAMAPFRFWHEGRFMEAPDFDVKESDDAFVFKADVPGIEGKHLDIRLAGNRLTVSGNRSEEKERKGETYFVSERAFGSFSRSFTLPEATDAEHVEADLSDGVLTITVPKLLSARPRQVEVKKS